MYIYMYIYIYIHIYSYIYIYIYSLVPMYVRCAGIITLMSNPMHQSNRIPMYCLNLLNDTSRN